MELSTVCQLIAQQQPTAAAVAHFRRSRTAAGWRAVADCIAYGLPIDSLRPVWDARCRTAALGGHIDECSRCGQRATISYNSCRNRHCPKCQTGARERWLAARRRELLP